MKRKIIIGIFAPAVLLLAFILNARSEERPGREMMKELREELQNFRNNSVFPEMTAWKAKLDGAMSGEDLSKLNELRKKASILREKMKSEMSAMRKSNMNKDDFDREAFKDKMKEQKQAMHKEMKALGEELKPLAEKYSKTLEEIAATAKPKTEEWKKQAKEIIEKWKDAHQDKIDEMKGDSAKHPGMKRMKKGMMKMNQRMGMKEEMGFNFDNKKAVGRFMLWDGSAFEAPEPPDAPSMTGVNDENPVFSELRNYPNPFSEKTKIYFTLKQKEKVTLKIIDNTGKIIATLFEGKLDAGERSFEFNASSVEYKKLTAGTYIYQLSAGSYQKSGKMVLTR